jgi:oligopeptide transport system permease protein
MTKFVLRRLMWLVVVLLVVSFITFALMHLVPGGPWDKEKQLAPQVIANLNQKYGLDKPFMLQYVNYMWGVAHGNLGVSYSYQDRGVTQIILEGLPKTATLGVLAFLLSIIIGIPLGMAAALRQNTSVDYVSVMFRQRSGVCFGYIADDFVFCLFTLAAHRWLGQP